MSQADTEITGFIERCRVGKYFDVVLGIVWALLTAFFDCVFIPKVNNLLR